MNTIKQTISTTLLALALIGSTACISTKAQSTGGEQNIAVTKTTGTLGTIPVYGYIKMTNNTGGLLIKPPTNFVAKTVEFGPTNGGFGIPTIVPFGATNTFVGDTYSVSCTNRWTAYLFTFYVTNNNPAVTNGTRADAGWIFSNP